MRVRGQLIPAETKGQHLWACSLWAASLKVDRGWRVGQPGSMVVGVSESQAARHARFVSADLELSQDRPPAITGVRGLRQDRSLPHICDASRARPS